MAVELVTVMWCDVCATDDRKTQAEQVTLGDRELELCEEHRAPVDAALALVAEHGRPAAPPARRKRIMAAESPDATDCPVCRAKLANRSSLATHLRNQHDAGPADYPDLFPSKRPPVDCPECGQSFIGHQGLYSHVRTTHPAAYPGFRQAVEQAKRQPSG